MSANGICDGLSKLNEFVRCFDKAGLTPELMSRIINCTDNIAAEEMVKAAEKAVHEDSLPLESYFGAPRYVTEFTPSATYDHVSQLAKARQNANGIFYPEITNGNFSKVTDRFDPTKKYSVSFVPIIRDVRSKKGLAFLRSKRGKFVGAQGASLIMEHFADIFPCNSGFISLDTEDNLGKDESGNSVVPVICHGTDERFDFKVFLFSEKWPAGTYLLLVQEIQ